MPDASSPIRIFLHNSGVERGISILRNLPPANLPRPCAPYSFVIPSYLRRLTWVTQVQPLNSNKKNDCLPQKVSGIGI